MQMLVIKPLAKEDGLVWLNRDKQTLCLIIYVCLPCLFSEALRSSLRDACLDCLGNSLTTFFRLHTPLPYPPNVFPIMSQPKQVQGILRSSALEGRILMLVFGLLSPPLTSTVPLTINNQCNCTGQEHQIFRAKLQGPYTQLRRDVLSYPELPLNCNTSALFNP